MQIKTTMRDYFTSVIVTAIHKSTNIKYWRGCGEKGTHLWHFYSVPKNVFFGIILEKIYFFFTKKTKKNISLHLSDLLVEQFSDCHVDYINFSSYEMKKKMVLVLIQWSFQGPLLRPGKNVM